MFEPVCAICSINSSTFSEVLQSLAVRHADRITNSEGPIYFFFLLTKKLEIRSRYLALRIFICYCLQIATAILLFFSSQRIDIKREHTSSRGRDALCRQVDSQPIAFCPFYLFKQQLHTISIQPH